jgi:hypothetical protein
MLLAADPRAVPVVATYAFRERWMGVPSPFEVTLAIETDNRYNPGAIAVLLSGAKIGYIAPELARPLTDALSPRLQAGEHLSCQARFEDPDTRVDARILLDMSAFDDLRSLA